MNMRDRNSTTTPRTRRKAETAILLLAALMAALTAACGREAPVAPGQYVSPQPYSAGIFDGYVVTGELSGRELPVKVRYPEGAEGPLPVAIFSHGAGALNNGHETYQEWGTRLAEAGYAVVHIAHVEGGTASHCAPLQILPEECRPLLLFTGDTLGAVWFNRPRDVTAVIDELDAIGAATGIELDMGRIALVGHSGGAHTVMSSAGAAIDFSPSVTGATYLDPRIRAFVALSPQGPGSLGFTDTSWDNMAAPMLIATGAADTGPTVDDPAMRRVPFQRMSGPGVYELFIDSPGRRAQRVRAE